MAMARPHHRALSTASSSPTDHPPPNTTSSTSTHVPIATAGASHRNSSNPNHKRSHSHTHNLNHRSNPSSSSSSPAPVHPSLLQPRVAVVLNVPPPWHPWLFALRLCSILPALWWGLPCALQLLLRLLPGPDRILVVRPNRACTTAPCNGGDDAVPFALTEGALATIWVRYPGAPSSRHYSQFANASPLLHVVLCLRISLLLLYRLPHVTMVSHIPTRDKLTSQTLQFN